MANSPLCLTLLVLLLIAVSQAQYEYCGTNRDVLLKALFDTGPNLFELDKVFFPPRSQTSRYIKVKYSFLDGNGDDPGNCTVTYIWAIGGFLLVQPPKIFQLTSLLFSTPANKLVNLNLQLPSTCKALVSNETFDNCSCEGDDRFALDRLTQQLNVYSRYGDPSQVVQDIESSAQSVCEANLKDIYFNGNEINLFLSLIVILPIIIMLVLAIVIRSTHKYVHTELTKSSIHHPMFAGVTLAGVHILLFVLCLDAAAVYFYATNTHEYSNDQVDRSFNLFVVAITISMDVVVALQFLFCMLYLCCSQTYKHCEFKHNTRRTKDNCTCFCERCFPFLLAPYFYVIFGGKKLIGRWKLQDQPSLDHTTNAENKLNLWVLMGTVVAPLFCVSSHAGYILIAWVTEPAKTTAAFLVGLGSFLYLFFVFRQCYIVYRDAEQGEQQQGEEEEPEPNSCCSRLLKCLFSELICGNGLHSRCEVFCSGLKWCLLAIAGTFTCCCCCCCCTNKDSFFSRLVSCCLGLKKNHIFCCKKHWIVWFFPIFTIPLFSLYNLCVNSLSTCVRVGICCCSITKKPTSPTVSVSWCPILTNDEALEKYWESVEVSDDANTFGIKSFCTACSWGWLIVGCLAFFLSAFFVLPVPTIQLAQYLENTIQIVIVILAFLVTYKIFSVEETVIKKFMRMFRRNYRKEDMYDDAEAAGAMLNDVVLDINSKNLDLLLQLNPETLHLFKDNPVNRKLLLKLDPNNLKLLFRLNPNTLSQILLLDIDTLEPLLKLGSNNLQLLLQLTHLNLLLQCNHSNLKLLLKLNSNNLQLLLRLTSENLKLLLKLECTITNNLELLLKLDPDQANPPAHDNLNLLLQLSPNTLYQILQLSHDNLALFFKLEADNLQLLLKLTTDKLKLFLQLDHDNLNLLLQLDHDNLELLLTTDNFKFFLQLTTDNLKLLLKLDPNNCQANHGNLKLLLNLTSNIRSHILRLNDVNVKSFLTATNLNYLLQNPNHILTLTNRRFNTVVDHTFR